MRTLKRFIRARIIHYSGDCASESGRAGGDYRFTGSLRASLRQLAILLRHSFGGVRASLPLDRSFELLESP